MPNDRGPDETRPPPDPKATLRVEPEVGTHIGPFALIEVLGRDGMGVVYKCAQDAPRRTVAVKVMQAMNAQDTERLLGEAQMLATLTHPNIAQVYVADRHQDRPYFAMEFVPNAQTILQHADHRNLDRASRAALAATLCDAVHHVHAKGILHCDIKPGNVLVGADGRLKLIDFGVARVASPTRDGSLREARAGGTLESMSPEQADGDPEALDARADVFSLGVLLHAMMLGGRRPYPIDATSRASVARSIRSAPAPRPRRLDPTLPRELAWIISKAVRADPAERFSGADKLRDALRRFLRAEPVGAIDGWPGYRRWVAARRVCLREPLLLGIAVLVLVLALAQIVGALAIDDLLGAQPAYEAAAIQVVSRRPSDPALIAAPITPVFAHTSPIVFDGATPFPELAAKAGLDPGDLGVDALAPDERTRALKRLVHAAFIDRLLDFNPRAIVFDLRFIPITPGDDAFADSLRRARAREIPVILGDMYWRPRDTDFSPGVREAAWAVGPVMLQTAQDGVAVPWRVFVAAKLVDGDIRPSISALAAAAYRQPKLFPSFRFGDSGDSLVVSYARPDRPGESAIPSDSLAFSPATEAAEDFPAFRMLAGDRSIESIPNMPSPADAARAVTRYEEAFSLSQHAGRARFADRLIVIYTTTNELAAHPAHAELLPRSLGHIASIEAMLSTLDRAGGSIASPIGGIRRVAGARWYAPTFAAALLGMGIARLTIGRWLPRLLLVIVAIGATAGLSLVTLETSGWLWTPTPAWVALILACSAWTLILQTRRELLHRAAALEPFEKGSP